MVVDLTRGHLSSCKGQILGLGLVQGAGVEESLPADGWKPLVELLDEAG